MTRYDDIGGGYSTTRREDPHLRSLIHAALGESRTVLNIGAGTGSYEPNDCFVVAADPSSVMLEQRPDNAPAAVQCFATPLPFRDLSFDSSMAVLTVHHWDEQLRSGVQELRRVTRGPIVIVTYDVHTVEPMWLMKDYLIEAAELDAQTFPTIAELIELLGNEAVVTPVAVHRDTPDWTLASFWAHPERVLDPIARNGTSGFSRQSEEVVERVVKAVEQDLNSGEWDRRYGEYRHLDSLDVGLRLVTTT